jgi:hypothetical protein
MRFALCASRSASFFEERLAWAPRLWAKPLRT